MTTIFKQSFFVLALAIVLNYVTYSFVQLPSLYHLSQRFKEPNTVKLYGSPMSTCTRRVALILREKNITYELIPVDLAKGEQKAPDYIESKQPFGQVPVLVDGDVQLYESRAIARYIAQKYAARGTPLLPPPGNLARLAQFEQAASIEQANFDAFASGIASELVFIPARGGKADHERVKTLTATLSGKLDAYDKILSKQAYLAGNEITLADLFHLPYGTLITKGSLISQERRDTRPDSFFPQKLELDLLTSPSRPHVARWWHDISLRAAWAAVEDGA